MALIAFNLAATLAPLAMAESADVGVEQAASGSYDAAPESLRRFRVLPTALVHQRDQFKHFPQETEDRPNRSFAAVG